MKPRLLALTVLGLLALPGQAGAATHAYLGSIRGLDDPCGVAVDGSGNTYVSDYNHQRVSVFSEGGLQFSIPSAKSENSPCALAVGPESQIYGNYLHQGVVELLSNTTIDPDRSTGVSVNPIDNRLYVAHRTHVSVYEADGTPVPLTIGTGSLVDAYGVAVSGVAGTAGYVYVGDASNDTVKVFDPATDPANPIEEIDGSGAPVGAFTDLTDTNLAIDPTDGDLFVTDNLQPGFEHPDAAVLEFAPDGSFVGQIGHWLEELPGPAGSPPLFFNRSITGGVPSGVAVDGKGNITVTSGTEEESFLYKFGPATNVTARLQVTKAGTGGGTVTSQLSGLGIPPATPKPSEPQFPPSSLFSGIDCGLICVTEYEIPPLETPMPSLSAVASPHSRFTGWSGACSGVAVCKPAITGGPVNVTATFESIPQQTLTVTKSGDGEGLVTSAPVGLDCGATCTTGFDQGSSVSLAAEAESGSEFTGWSGACSGSASCVVVLDQDRAVSANFKSVPAPTAGDPSKTPRRLAISVVGSGSGSITSEPSGIDCGTPCSSVYAPGTVVTLIATPDSESHFSGWSGCDNVAEVRCTVKLDASRTVGASFDEGPAIQLGTFRSKGGKGSLPVTVPGTGVVKATGKGMKPSTVTAKKGGTVSLSLALNDSGKKALAVSSKGKHRVKVTVTFSPSGGGTSIVTDKSIVFKKRNK